VANDEDRRTLTELGSLAARQVREAAPRSDESALALAQADVVDVFVALLSNAELDATAEHEVLLTLETLAALKPTAEKMMSIAETLIELFDQHPQHSMHWTVVFHNLVAQASEHDRQTLRELNLHRRMERLAESPDASLRPLDARCVVVHVASCDENNLGFVLDEAWLLPLRTCLRAALHSEAYLGVHYPPSVPLRALYRLALIDEHKALITSYFMDDILQVIDPDRAHEVTLDTATMELTVTMAVSLVFAGVLADGQKQTLTRIFEKLTHQGCSEQVRRQAKIGIFNLGGAASPFAGRRAMPGSTTSLPPARGAADTDEPARVAAGATSSTHLAPPLPYTQQIAGEAATVAASAEAAAGPRSSPPRVLSFAMPGVSLDADEAAGEESLVDAKGSVFISAPGEHLAFAQLVRSWLVREQYECLITGERPHDTFAFLQNADCVVVCVSSAYKDSDICKAEVRLAMRAHSHTHTHSLSLTHTHTHTHAYPVVCRPITPTVRISGWC
jgi:hypothetical protein